MLFVRTSSGIAAKPIFVSSGYHAEIPHHPTQQDSQRRKEAEIGLDWRLKGISGPVYSA